MSDAETIRAMRDIVQASSAPAVFQLPNNRTGVLIPDGHEIKEFSPVDPVLTRIRQRVTMHDRDSFTEYVSKYRGPNTIIMASPGFLSSTGKPMIAAVLDYHGPGQPDYAAHVVTYSPRYSESWITWQNACKSPLKQAAFAEFVEEVRDDIREPSSLP